jgi:hypothetical protein
MSPWPYSWNNVTIHENIHWRSCMQRTQTSLPWSNYSSCFATQTHPNLYARSITSWPRRRSIRSWCPPAFRIMKIRNVWTNKGSSHNILLL